MWCKKRLDELDGKESILNPLWYAGSFAIGAIFGRYGEKVSLGFVEETEKQVVVHLDKHLNKISSKDKLKVAFIYSLFSIKETCPVPSFSKLLKELSYAVFMEISLYSKKELVAELKLKSDDWVVKDIVVAKELLIFVVVVLDSENTLI